MTRSRVLQLGNLLFWLLVVTAALRYVVPKWREFELSSRLSGIDRGWLAGAILVLLLQYLAVFALWRRVIHVLGSTARRGELFRAFALSLLPTYVPGKLLGPGVRTSIAASSGISYPVVVGSLFWELGLTLAAATVITTLGVGLNVSHELDPAARWLAFVVAVAGVAGVAVALTPRIRTILATWLHPRAALRQPRAVAVLFLGYVGSFWMYTAAHWMLARAIAPFAVRQAVPLLVALAASWTLGVVSLFAPAGLGVREGVLFLFARGPMGAPMALLFVTLSRLVMFAVEVLLTLGALAAGPHAKRVTATDAPPP
jgi:hypothetical protein